MAAAFGDTSFLTLVGEGKWDLLCHHAADVTNYKSPGFDAISARSKITPRICCRARISQVGGLLQDIAHWQRFEGGEGAGSQGLPDLSAYGLSKA